MTGDCHVRFCEKLAGQFRGLTHPNTNSPINVLGKGAYRQTHIIYVNQLSNDAAEVRFSTTTHNVAKDSATTKQWQAIVKWTYRHITADEHFTAKNPLGFTVTDYDKSEAM